MRRQSILGFSSAALCLCISVAACDKANLTEVMKLAGQVTGDQTAEGGTSGSGVAGLLKDAPVPDEKPPAVSPAKLASLGNELYNKEIEQRKEKNEIETNNKVTDQMDRIFDQLKSAALADQEYGAVAKEMDWRLTTIRDKEIVMAKAYPGGGVAIYNGVFHVAENEGALAAILGHEMAHVLARHELKRIAGHAAVAAAAVGSGVALAMKPEKRDRQVIAGITGALAIADLFGGRQAWERAQEHDADCLGLRLSARAGYDPKKLEGFWQRMKAIEDSEGAKNKYQFLNDHPITPDRLDHIKDTCIPKAQEVYDQVEQTKRQNASATLPGVGFEG